MAIPIKEKQSSPLYKDVQYRNQISQVRTFIVLPVNRLQLTVVQNPANKDIKY